MLGGDSMVGGGGWWKWSGFVGVGSVSFVFWGGVVVVYGYDVGVLGSGYLVGSQVWV